MTPRFHHDDRDSGRLPDSDSLVGASVPEPHPVAQTVRAALEQQLAWNEGRSEMGMAVWETEAALAALDVLVGRLEAAERLNEELTTDYNALLVRHSRQETAMEQKDEALRQIGEKP